MKKIKSIRQLRSEKKRMLNEQEELEACIGKKWNELKESLQPVNFAKDTLDSVLRKKTASFMQEDNILKDTFTYGAALFARKFADKAEEKFEKIFKK